VLKIIDIIHYQIWKALWGGGGWQDKWSIYNFIMMKWTCTLNDKPYMSVSLCRKIIESISKISIHVVSFIFPNTGIMDAK